MAIEEVHVEDGDALAWGGGGGLAPVQGWGECFWPELADVGYFLGEARADFSLLVDAFQDGADDGAAADRGFEGERAGLAEV